MPRSGPPTRGNWTIIVKTEEGARFPIIRAHTDAPSSERAGRVGPLDVHREILNDTLGWANTRALLDGARASIGKVESWRFSTQCRRDDLDLIREGLQRLVDDGDEMALRVAFNLPMPYRTATRLAPILWSG
jgi:hypothetical protein